MRNFFYKVIKILFIVFILLVFGTGYWQYLQYNSFESVLKRYNQERINLLEAKLKNAKDCIDNLRNSWEETKLLDENMYNDCKYGFDGKLQIMERLGMDIDPKEHYDFPSDLKFTLLKKDNVYITQSERVHYAENGMLAVDMGTNNRNLWNYAPALFGKEVQWEVYIEDFPNSTGKTLILDHDGNRFLIGHLRDIEVKLGQYINTGEVIGRTGGSEQGEGISIDNRNHLHIQYFTFSKEKGDWVESVYNELESNINKKWKDNITKGIKNDIRSVCGEDSCEELKPIKNTSSNSSEYWYISSYYSPVAGQLEYYNGSYSADKSMNCGVGSCEDTASGYKLKPEDKYQVVACPKEFKFGTRFRITLPEDHNQYPNKSWVVRCEDRGGAIRTSNTNKTGQNQLDLWSGYGVKGEGLSNIVWIGEMSTKKALVEVLQ